MKIIDAKIAQNVLRILWLRSFFIFLSMRQNYTFPQNNPSDLPKPILSPQFPITSLSLNTSQNQIFNFCQGKEIAFAGINCSRKDIFIREKNIFISNVTISMRSLYILIRFVYICMRGLYISIRFVYICMRGLYIVIRYVYICMRSVDISIRNVYICMRSVDISIRYVYICMRNGLSPIISVWIVWFYVCKRRFYFKIIPV